MARPHGDQAWRIKDRARVYAALVDRHKAEGMGDKEARAAAKVIVQGQGIMALAQIVKKYGLTLFQSTLPLCDGSD